MTTAYANSEQSLSKLIGDLRELWREHKYLRISIKAGKDRSLDQNATSHVWYAQIAAELREDTAEGVKCECKLRFGVPLLRAEDADFREMYDAAIKKSLTYEQKLKAMRFLPVTSLLSTKQMTRYLSDIQAEYAHRGVILEFLSDQEDGGE